MSAASTPAGPATVASSPLIAGLLQSLGQWQTGGAPGLLNNTLSQYGGTSGLLDALMQGAGANTPQARMGAALENARANALKSAGAREQLAQDSLGLNLMAAKLPAIEAYYRMLGGMMGVGSAQGTPQSQASPRTQPSPQSAPSGPRGPSGLGVLQPQYLRRAAAASPAAPSAPAAAAAGGGAGLWGSPLGVMRFGALGSAFGLPGGQQFFDYGKTALQYSPQVAQAMAAAKSPTAIDLMQLRAATAQGNPLLARTALLKYLKDTGAVTVGEYNGNVTTLGGINPAALGISGFNPRTGTEYVNGTESPIPGAPATRGALAAAEERGRIGAGLSPVGASALAPIGPFASSPLAPRRAPSSRGQPSIAPQGQAAIDTPGYIPPILGAPARAPMRSGGMGIEAVQEFQKGQAEEAQKEQGDLVEDADNAQTLLVQSKQIEEAARNFAPGKWASVKGEVLAALQPTGMLTPEELKSLGSYQEGQKLAIQLQAVATKALGSREAAQIFEVMGKSIPNLTLSPDGLAKISAYMQGMARYNITRAEYAQRLAAQDNIAGLNSLEQNFQSYTNPVYYILASAPPAVARELIANMRPSERARVQSGWKQAITNGLAPAPGEID